MFHSDDVIAKATVTTSKANDDAISVVGAPSQPTR